MANAFRLQQWVRNPHIDENVNNLFKQSEDYLRLVEMGKSKWYWFFHYYLRDLKPELYVKDMILKTEEQ